MTHFRELKSGTIDHLFLLLETFFCCGGRKVSKTIPEALQTQLTQRSHAVTSISELPSLRAKKGDVTGEIRQVLCVTVTW